MVRCAPWSLIKIESAIVSKTEADLTILGYDEKASRPLFNLTFQVADAQVTSIGDLSLVLAEGYLQTVF